ncbi:MAG: carboxypeptidase-like regulatory domain-containing protein, partial [Bacteroidales bacterium]|nr:carboxypeptidase-like regulatory domain-containing protein [Bacteroidales bacterium]
MKTNLMIIILILASVSAFAQNLTVSGTVTETATGYPAIGAAVMVKGTSVGTVTDADGMYSLGDVPSDAVLVFSSIGFRTTEVPVGGKSVINVSLEADAELLEEIVV